MKLNNPRRASDARYQRAFAQLQPIPTLPVPGTERGHSCPQQGGSGEPVAQSERPQNLEDAADRNVRAPRNGRATQAFTLVEMLLVLVILGVLAAIVYPKIAGRGEQARVTATMTQISAFKTALDAFEVDNGYYPKGKNGLMDLVVRPRDAVNWHGPYLDSIPKDPWQNEYIYECPGRHNPSSYDLMSAGPDGRVGSEDDICNWQAR